MKEIDIVKKVCEILDIKFHHYDNHNMPVNYFPPFTGTSKPKIVLYSSQCGPWEFAILEDMSILSVNSQSFDMISMFGETYLANLEGEHKAFFEKISKQKEKLKSAETFLKENDCAKVINNPSKKINI